MYLLLICGEMGGIRNMWVRIVYDLCEYPQENVESEKALYYSNYNFCSLEIILQYDSVRMKLKDH